MSAAVEAPTFSVVPIPARYSRTIGGFTPTRESRAIGRRLRCLRVDKGKTLDQVVEAVPVLSSATLSRTELGTRDTPMSQLKALANYFGVSVDDITKPSDEAEPWELPEPSRYQPKPETTVMTPEQYALRVYIPRLEAENAELREQLAMFRGER